MNKIRHLEESVRCQVPHCTIAILCCTNVSDGVQEELMEMLKTKLCEGPTNGENHHEE